MRAYERFLKYIHFETASDERSEACPSTESQKVLGAALVEEMCAMGISDAKMDENGYVYGTIPATKENLPAIGLIAHMDTVDCVPAGPMRERIVPEYDGSDIILESGDPLSAKDFPELLLRKGKSLIVTDGHTLLGADDKAGIAEIMTACESVLASGKPHGKICIGFTPDEEIGRGADRFDVKQFGADFAYTVDGDTVGGIEYENFNAASLKLTFHGRSVHPGSAKNRMVNAALLAMEFNSMLPCADRPEHTEGYEGFFHLCAISGETEIATSEYIIRDHSMSSFEARKALCKHAAEIMNERYGAGTVECEIRDSYFNMLEVVSKNPDILKRAENAYRAIGVEPFSKPIRGGTDGSKLSFMGLPCPNLATGGMNYHGRFECIAIEDMDTMAEVLFKLVTIEE